MNSAIVTSTQQRQDHVGINQLSAEWNAPLFMFPLAPFSPRG